MVTERELRTKEWEYKENQLHENQYVALRKQHWRRDTSQEQSLFLGTSV